MYVDATSLWRVEKLTRQNAAVGDDDHQIGIVRTKECDRFRSLDLSWLVNSEALRDCQLLNWTGSKFVASSSGLIRLRPYRCDLVPTGNQSL